MAEQVVAATTTEQPQSPWKAYSVWVFSQILDPDHAIHKLVLDAEIGHTQVLPSNSPDESIVFGAIVTDKPDAVDNDSLSSVVFYKYGMRRSPPPPIIIMFAQQLYNPSATRPLNRSLIGKVAENNVFDLITRWIVGYPISLLTRLRYGINSVMQADNLLTETRNFDTDYRRQLATVFGDLIQNADSVIEYIRTDRYMGKTTLQARVAICDDASISVQQLCMRAAILDVLALLYYVYARIHNSQGQREYAKACMALSICTCHDVIDVFEQAKFATSMWIPPFTCGMLVRTSTISGDGTWTVDRPFAVDKPRQKQYLKMIQHLWNGMMYDIGQKKWDTQNNTVFTLFKDVDGLGENGAYAGAGTTGYAHTELAKAPVEIKRARLGLMLHVTKCYITGMCERARGWAAK